jgi:hypothetical protein
MQNCWMFVSWPCIEARLVTWVLIDSCVVTYAAPKFASDLLYNAIVALLSMAAVLQPC